MIYHTTTDQLDIAYHEMGTKDKPVVLLLHGWPDDATAWEQVMPELMSAGYRVIAPYLRGFGETRFLDEDTPRTGNSGIHALDIISLLDALDIENLSVIGHDWGANIAESLAVNWPNRIEKIALLSTPPRLGGMPTPPFEHAQLEWYHWFQATKRGQEAVKADPIGFAHIMWVNWSPEGWFDEATFAKVAQSWQNKDFVPVTLHSYQSRWEEVKPDPESIPLEEKVKSTKTLPLPAIYVQGMADGVNTPKTSEKVHEKFTGPFKRIELPGVGHFPSREAPAELTRYLLDFLKQQND